MPRFTIPGATALSCADDKGRAFYFPFPYETDSPAEIRLLVARGAEEMSIPVPTPIPEKTIPEKTPEKLSEKKDIGGEV